MREKKLTLKEEIERLTDLNSDLVKQLETSREESEKKRFKLETKAGKSGLQLLEIVLLDEDVEKLLEIKKNTRVPLFGIIRQMVCHCLKHTSYWSMSGHAETFSYHIAVEDK